MSFGVVAVKNLSLSQSRLQSMKSARNLPVWVEGRSSHLDSEILAFWKHPSTGLDSRRLVRRCVGCMWMHFDRCSMARRAFTSKYR